MMTLDQAALQLAPGASRAEELMTPSPMSIRQGATVSEAAAFLAEKGISAAPVIDVAGRPIGVVSSTDILIHMGGGAVSRRRSPEYFSWPERSAFSGDGSRTEAATQSKVRDVMTPGVFCVRPEMPAAKVVETMLGLKVRRLFVVDGDGVLIGVISAIDMLGKFRRSGLHDG